MSISWNQVPILASLLSVFLALIALIIQSRQSQRALQTNALMSILLRFDTDKMRAFRCMAATYLRNKGGSESEAWAVQEVLDFFGEIAFFINSKAINSSLAYSQFSWWLIRYWLCSQEFIKMIRNYDPYSWAMLEKIANRLHKEEMKEGYTVEDYSKENIKASQDNIENENANYIEDEMGNMQRFVEESLLNFDKEIESRKREVTDLSRQLRASKTMGFYEREQIHEEIDKKQKELFVAQKKYIKAQEAQFIEKDKKMADLKGRLKLSFEVSQIARIKFTIIS